MLTTPSSLPPSKPSSSGAKRTMESAREAGDSQGTLSLLLTSSKLEYHLFCFPIFSSCHSIIFTLYCNFEVFFTVRQIQTSLLVQVRPKDPTFLPYRHFPLGVGEAMVFSAKDHPAVVVLTAARSWSSRT